MNGNHSESGRVFFAVTEIGAWTAGMGTGGTVEETSRETWFWDCAPVAVVDPDLGDTVLADGCHLYAAARDRGIGRLPVRQGRWADWFGDG